MKNVSVVIPAHNEEAYIGKCIDSIVAAAREADISVEIIVVCNRCTDSTSETAESFGSKVIQDDSRCIAAVRNTGIRTAAGPIIITIDADSVMPISAICEIEEKLESGEYIGGGAIPVFDRTSPGIFFSTLYVAGNMAPTIIRNKAFLSGAMFWFYKEDYEAVGGFNEQLVSLEDMDFAVRMNKLGQSRGKKWGTLKEKLITSSRKFDQFGDWYLIKNRKITKRIFTGKDREAADQFYYDAR